MRPAGCGYRRLDQCVSFALKQSLDCKTSEVPRTDRRLKQAPAQIRGDPGSSPSYLRLNMTHIKKHERGLVFRKGDYVRSIGPGSHFTGLLPGVEVTILDTYKLFKITKNLKAFREDAELMSEMKLLDVPDNSIALHFADGHLVDVFGSGMYAYWNAVTEHSFQVHSMASPRMEPALDSSILANAGLKDFIQRFQVDAHQKGLLFFDGVFQGVVGPGAYYFWKGPVQVSLSLIDMRQQQIDMTGQEILTLDRVSVRINFVCQYRITEPEKIAQMKSYEEQLYIVLQLILREYVGTLTLDDLLQKKEEINQFVLSRLKEKTHVLGVEFTSAGVKDIVLPGDFKEIMNLVLIAERKAQANLITRREEIASTRSLLNTARLMDENPTLYRLKELEFVERISEKVGSISLSSGAGFLEQLTALISTKKPEKA
jgi:regulator of protease activity HflC (stomatin/prohibitin superfamily)